MKHCSTTLHHPQQSAALQPGTSAATTATHTICRPALLLLFNICASLQLLPSPAANLWVLIQLAQKRLRTLVLANLQQQHQQQRVALCWAPKSAHDQLLPQACLRARSSPAAYYMQAVQHTAEASC
jgi:hypothetical protein